VHFEWKWGAAEVRTGHDATVREKSGMTVARVIAAEPPTEAEQARAAMLSALARELDRSAVPYCFLSGHQESPLDGQSDVDFMVWPRDAGWVRPLLARVAEQCGALVVQAIQHETGAWYFALAKQVQGGVAYLHPDCTTDYRSRGRLWLRAEELLAGRRRCLELSVPAAAGEFEYYLIKKVLKQQIDCEQLWRLRQLYLSSPAECCARMRRRWPAQSVGAVISAMLLSDVARMRWHLPRLLRDLQASAPLENRWARMLQAAREGRRWIRRALHPTGMSVTICGGRRQQRDEFAACLEEQLRPAFRRTRVVDSAGPTAAVCVWLAWVRSTLVIRNLASSPGLRFGLGQVVFHLDSRQTPDVDSATRVVLEWMASRVAKRQWREG
jgi:hypothetical protein